MPVNVLENPIDIRRNITELAVSFKDTLNRSFQKTYKMKHVMLKYIYERISRIL